MKVGNTPTGEAINIEDNPFQGVMIQFPKIGLIWDVTDDLGSGNQTMQAVGNSMTNNPDWSSSSHFNHSNARNGQGSLIVTRNSPSDNLFVRAYNAVNPCGGDSMEKALVLARNAPEAWFNVVFYNKANPNIRNEANGCFFQNVAPAQYSNGTNNSQDTDTWTFLATTVHRSVDDITPSTTGQLMSGKVDAFNSSLGTDATTYQNLGNLAGTGEDHLVTD